VEIETRRSLELKNAYRVSATASSFCFGNVKALLRRHGRPRYEHGCHVVLAKGRSALVPSVSVVASQTMPAGINFVVRLLRLMRRI
jgi:hypothetical protein